MPSQLKSVPGRHIGRWGKDLTGHKMSEPSGLLFLFRLWLRPFGFILILGLVIVVIVRWDIENRIAESFQETGTQSAHAFIHSLPRSIYRSETMNVGATHKKKNPYSDQDQGKVHFLECVTSSSSTPHAADKPIIPMPGT